MTAAIVLGGVTQHPNGLFYGRFGPSRRPGEVSQRRSWLLLWAQGNYRKSLTDWREEASAGLPWRTPALHPTHPPCPGGVPSPQEGSQGCPGSPPC